VDPVGGASDPDPADLQQPAVVLELAAPRGGAERAVFSRRDPIRVAFFTWNVAQKPASAGLSRSVAFLFSDENDLVVVGLQEIDFSVRALVLGSSVHTVEWAELFKRVGGEAGYSILADRSLGGVYLAILKRADLALPASAEIIDSVRLGAPGLACNKSAVLAVLRLNETEIGIIAAHLVAYIPNLQARNEQLGQLMRGLSTTS
jgi:hypothetical protein